MLQSTCATMEPSNISSADKERCEQVEKSVAAKLQESGVGSRRAVCCQFREGVLVLSGSLPSYYHKQMAQEIAGQEDKVSRVVNRIQVKPLEIS